MLLGAWYFIALAIFYHSLHHTELTPFLKEVTLAVLIAIIGTIVFAK